MSSNRLKYDLCEYSTEIKESTAPLDYRLYLGAWRSCNPCAIADNTTDLEFGLRADMSSELSGRTRPNSNCPMKKFNPNDGFKPAAISPPSMCQSIYHMTPNNIQKPKSNMLNEGVLGKLFCN
jgi:hypothetical protein